MNAYEIKKAERIRRMRARSQKLTGEAEASLDRMHAIGDRIPLGQPIIVGHHSERKHRRDIARMDNAMRKSVEASKEAVRLDRAADRAESNDSISSDDHDAIVKLEAKLDEERAAHARLLRMNAMLRKGVPDLEVLALVEDPAEKKNFAFAIGHYRSMGQKTLPTTNGNAGIRRIEERLDALKKRRDNPPKDAIAGEGFRIEESREDNRVRIVFDDVPSDAMRTKLKSHGFKWAPSVNARQRLATPMAWTAACYVMGVR